MITPWFGTLPSSQLCTRVRMSSVTACAANRPFAKVVVGTGLYAAESRFHDAVASVQGALIAWSDIVAGPVFVCCERPRYAAFTTIPGGNALRSNFTTMLTDANAEPVTEMVFEEPFTTAGASLRMAASCVV
jgi:hypothetical protein